VVIEPLVQAAAGMRIGDPDDLRPLGAACRESGILLICDEVATGFGRTGSLFASTLCDLSPDLMCLGKGITGGYLPMSATVASKKVFDAFLERASDSADTDRTFYHGHSYGGNALAAAVALRHLELIEERNVLSNVRARATELKEALASRIATLEAVSEVRQCGLMVGVELVPPAPPTRLGRLVSQAAVQRGVLLRPLGDVVVIMPPLTVRSDEILRVVEVLRESILEQCAASSGT
jgi:adenosylmethionine-8-amino-7-oxononanoate aminotransferase